MNSNIKQIADQVGMTLIDSPLWSAKLEQYTAAIVKECSTIVSHTASPYKDEGFQKTYDPTWRAACLASALKIRKHFGVE